MFLAVLPRWNAGEFLEEFRHVLVVMESSQSGNLLLGLRRGLQQFLNKSLANSGFDVRR